MLAAVLMLAGSPGMPPPCTATRYVEAMSSWRKGELAFKSGQWRRADRFYALGIARLGIRYMQGDAWRGGMPIDDTGQHLNAVDYAIQDGNYRAAARGRGGVLDNRLQLYRDGWRCR